MAPCRFREWPADIRVGEAGAFITAARGDHRSCLGNALRDLGKEAYQSLRRPVRGEPDDAGQPRAPRAEGESRGSAHAHAGNDDGAGAAPGQARDRLLELGKAIEERPVAPAPIRPAHLGPLDQIARTLDCRRERAMVPSGESVLPCIRTTPMVCPETDAAMPTSAASVTSPRNSRLMSGLPDAVTEECSPDEGITNRCGCALLPPSMRCHVLTRSSSRGFAHTRRHRRQSRRPSDDA
jgi:hypothetical protein